MGVQGKYLGVALAGLLMIALWHWIGAGVFAGLCYGGYRFSLKAHSREPCPACGGSGRHYGWFFSRNWRPCRRCDGGNYRHRGGVRRGLAGNLGQDALAANKRRGRA